MKQRKKAIHLWRLREAGLNCKQIAESLGMTVAMVSKMSRRGEKMAQLDRVACKSPSLSTPRQIQQLTRTKAIFERDLIQQQDRLKQAKENKETAWCSWLSFVIDNLVEGIRDTEAAIRKAKAKR